ncbi:MAG: ClpXP protease specificity-enhancing factor [Gammaproteobacteria bacterium]|nr:ClpXP protease specificity-enhancing factor [Gammaproteobacteria bacterium]
MLSNRPYLLRAFYQWILDSACTPILVIDANHPRSKIPKDYAEGGEIVFNISSVAVRDLKMLNDVIEFKASFSGVIHIISAPIAAILAVYAEENGEGIFFDPDDEDTSDRTIVPLKSIEGYAKEDYEKTISSQDRVTKSKPFLKLVE